jgi:uncharacterized protein
MRARVKSAVVATTSRSWRLNFPTAVAVWACVVILALFLGLRLGYGGLRFAIALGVGAALFAFEFFLAAPSVLAKVRDWLGEHSGVIALLVPLFAVLIYSFAVTGEWKWLLAGAAYAIVPALLLARNRAESPGIWQDYLAVAIIWLPVEFRWMYRIFPYPPQLTHIITILMGVCTGVAAFVLLRRLEGVGYEVAWGGGFGWIVAINIVLFGVIAVPLGIRIGFLTYAPSLAHLHSLPVSALGILLFTAWPEEFLFRGLLQNLFSRTFRNQWAGLICASVVFGFSHILHGPFPNWKYVLLATIAGIFYGRAWMKSGSLLPSTLVHAIVDISWHVLFR